MVKIPPFYLIVRPSVQFCNQFATSSFNHQINSAPWWQIKKIRPLFIYNYVCITLKKWPYFFDSGALSAISAFQSLNKLGPLVADFKIAYAVPAGPHQDHFSPVSSRSGKLINKFLGANWNCAYPLSNASLKK